MCACNVCAFRQEMPVSSENRLYLHSGNRHIDKLLHTLSIRLASSKYVLFASPSGLFRRVYVCVHGSSVEDAKSLPKPYIETFERLYRYVVSFFIAHFKQ